MDKCVICGGIAFGPGPGGRKAVTGAMPRCETCQSLERHRAIRGFFEQVYDPMIFGRLRVLQFSKDPSVRPEWFKEYEYSVFGGHNSLDLCSIDRPTGAYDLVICNHVLEHVPDDAAALREMLRVIHVNGAIFLSVPDPCRQTTTRDWGFADEKQHGHRRYYGADIVLRFTQQIPHAIVQQVALEDKSTGTPDVAFIISYQLNEITHNFTRLHKKYL